jgi:hypothetical protein
MDEKTFQYILSKQAEWSILYKQQQDKYKLQKNRAEKARVREAKVKETLKLSENKD